MRDRIYILLLIMLATAFLSEMKMNFFDDKFRFSLGIAAFFFGILWYRTVPVLLTGSIVGVFIVTFRILLSVWLNGISWADAFSIHFPSVFYYLSFAAIIQATKLRNILENPIRVGVIGAFADVTSNFVELTVRYLFGEFDPYTWKAFIMLVVFGSLRSFFVVGLYNIFSIRQVRALSYARQSELDHLLLINSTLSEEALYLKKSMSNIEEITRKSYHLYKRLMEIDPFSPLAGLALQIAENTHEVKKDSQRIVAGLSKIINQEQLAAHVSILNLCKMVIRANEKYADSLGKKVQFTFQNTLHMTTNQVYSLLSALNNLVANAVEAIFTDGMIELVTTLEGDFVVFSVKNSGPPILEGDRGWIFEPGYTTKYDERGNPSTGIGLSHTRDIVHSLQGEVEHGTAANGMTEFRIRIPKSQLMRKE